MFDRRTNILAAVLLIAIIVATAAYTNLSRAAASAIDRAHDLSSARTQLAEISLQRHGRLTSVPKSGDDADLGRQLRSAATEAGIANQLTSIEPGQTTRVHDADYTETPVFLRLNAATLKQIVTMLAQLGSAENAIRIKSIELSVPPAEPLSTTVTNERWTADLTVSYLIYSPRRQSGQ